MSLAEASAITVGNGDGDAVTWNVGGTSRSPDAALVDSELEGFKLHRNRPSAPDVPKRTGEGGQG